MKSISPDGIEDESTVVLYEPEGGHIVHVYHVVTIKGGVHPPPKEVERSALAHLSPAQLGQKILALHVPTEAITAGRLFRVDPEKRSLIELPVQPSRSGFKIH